MNIAKTAAIVLAAMAAAGVQAGDSLPAKKLPLGQAEGKTTPQSIKARERMQEDRKTYSTEEINEIEKLYQSANRNLQAPEAKESLKILVEKYKKANRTGCAVLYLAMMNKGKEQIKLLEDAIENYSDCFYGDGVQVGAYARYHLLCIYLDKGDKTKASKLAKETKTLFPDAVDHKGKSLKDSIDKAIEKYK